jgi:hypothetical protein
MIYLLVQVTIPVYIRQREMLQLQNFIAPACRSWQQVSGKYFNATWFGWQVQSQHICGTDSNLEIGNEHVTSETEGDKLTASSSDTAVLRLACTVVLCAESIHVHPSTGGRAVIK